MAAQWQGNKDQQLICLCRGLLPLQCSGGAKLNVL